VFRLEVLPSKRTTWDSGQAGHCGVLEPSEICTWGFIENRTKSAGTKNRRKINPPTAVYRTFGLSGNFFIEIWSTKANNRRRPRGHSSTDEKILLVMSSKYVVSIFKFFFQSSLDDMRFLSTYEFNKEIIKS